MKKHCSHTGHTSHPVHYSVHYIYIPYKAQKKYYSFIQRLNFSTASLGYSKIQSKVVRFLLCSLPPHMHTLLCYKHLLPNQGYNWWLCPDISQSTTAHSLHLAFSLSVLYILWVWTNTTRIHGDRTTQSSFGAPKIRCFTGPPLHRGGPPQWYGRFSFTKVRRNKQNKMSSLWHLPICLSFLRLFILFWGSKFPFSGIISFILKNFL